jgi:hypothetical protein
MSFAYSGGSTGKIALGSTTGNFSGETISVSSDVTNQYTYSTTNIPAGWNHAVIQWNSSTTKWDIYINGTAHSTSTFGTNEQGKFALKFGNRSSFYYDGKLDDIRVYSDQLTSGEITAIYNNTTASIPADNLVAHYKFDGDARDEQQLYDGDASNVTYAYDGTATNVTYQEATNFSPDLVWLKTRSQAYNHSVYDSLRGANKLLQSNTTIAEATATNAFNSFDSNGFTLGSGENSNSISGLSSVAWCFNAGTAAAASNTDGSITSTVKANQDAGFSIVSYTGNQTSSTIGHGLSSAPEMIIAKSRSVAQNWAVYHKDAGNQYWLQLNSTSAKLDEAIWNDTTPTDSVFSINNNVVINANSSTNIAYCFHSVDGFQKVGSYTGTGAAGNMVETGFEPAFVIIKNSTSGTGNWYMFDNKRLTLPYSDQLAADSSGAEATGTYVKFISNGFQLDTSASDLNTGSQTFIYLAIAADPDTTTPTVENSFDVVTYTGDGTSSKSIDTDFKPDLVWIKNRDQADNHILSDAVRGINLPLVPNGTNAEGAGTGYVTSYDSTGFTLGSQGSVNTNNEDYVAWCWKAGDHDDNLPQINTEGTIDSVVSVNDAAGFSIVQWEGDNSQPATIGHGLSAAPELIIHKDLDSTTNWHVYHESVMNAGDAKFLRLNTTNSILTDGLDDVWTSGFSATTFGVGKANNNTGRTQIAYCFTSITGYQKVGSYTGTGATGNVINVGFKPRWIMFKRTDSTGVWFVLDGIRNTSDVWSARIEANKTNAEAGPDAYTVTVSNTGFEMTGSFATYSEANASGGTYIYLAIK